MNKTSTIACPFSKSACRECGIYRGRHIEFCINPKYKAKPKNVDHPRGLTNEVAADWDSPEVINAPALVVNVEDDFNEWDQESWASKVQKQQVDSHGNTPVALERGNLRASGASIEEEAPRAGAPALVCGSCGGGDASPLLIG